MCADDAFVVAQPSTPASYFHLLRRHTLGDEHRPMVVFTPKSMLRRKEAASKPEDFTEGTFRAADRPTRWPTRSKVDTLLLCSGRITWDLMVERGQAAGRRPDHRDRPLRAALPRAAGRAAGRDRALPEPARDPLGPGRAGQHGPGAAPAAEPVRRARPAGEVISRPASSSPSVGSHSRHVEEQKADPHRGLRRGGEHAGRELLSGVLHRPRRRGARLAPGRGGGHPGLAGRAPLGVHRRAPGVRDRRSSGSPPGWPASTTPTTTEPVLAG